MPDADTLHVPQELVDVIIDHLHEDIPTLRSCSLVSRSWVPASRLHLFFRLELNFLLVPFPKGTRLIQASRAASNKCRVLAQFLESSPGVVQTIRELVLRPDPVLNYVRWGRTRPEIAPVLDRLAGARVTRLELGLDIWDELSADVKGSVNALLRALPLTYLHVHGGWFLWFVDIRELLGACRGLKELRLTSITCRYVAVEDHVEVAQGVRAELDVLHAELSFSSFPEWLVQPRCPLSIAKLRELRVAIGREFVGVGKLIRAASASLEHLELTINKPDYSPGGPFPYGSIGHIDLSVATHLRSVRILGLEQSERFSPVPWITSLFSRASTCLCLEEIEMHIRIVLLEPSFLDWAPWNDVDGVLSGPELPHLHRVAMMLEMDAGPECIGAQVEGLGAQMPVLQARGVLGVLGRPGL